MFSLCMCRLSLGFLPQCVILWPCDRLMTPPGSTRLHPTDTGIGSSSPMTPKGIIIYSIQMDIRESSGHIKETRHSHIGACSNCQAKFTNTSRVAQYSLNGFTLKHTSEPLPILLAYLCLAAVDAVCISKTKTHQVEIQVLCFTWQRAYFYT